MVEMKIAFLYFLKHNEAIVSLEGKVAAHKDVEQYTK